MRKSGKSALYLKQESTLEIGRAKRMKKKFARKRQRIKET